MWLNKGMQALPGLREHANPRTAVKEEGELLCHLIADGVADLGICRQDCNLHMVPPWTELVHTADGTVS
jgi:hypothetical protein